MPERNFKQGKIIIDNVGLKLFEMIGIRLFFHSNLVYLVLFGPKLTAIVQYSIVLCNNCEMMELIG